jgi:membrane fusion protein, adhesin transport system
MDENHVKTMETRIRPRLTSNLLLWLILAFFIAALLWASLTELDKSVHGLGRVIPSSQLQTVSNLEGGIVDEIFVHTGDRVEAGASLIRLDQTLSGAELGSSNATIAALVAKVERLRAEVTGGTPSFPAGVDGGVDVERALYRSRIAELTSLASAGSARVAAAERAVTEARSVLTARQSAAAAARTELTMISPLVERGIEPRLALIEAQTRATASAAEAAAAAAALSRVEAGIAEASATRTQQIQDWRSRAGGELEAAQAELSARRTAIPALADRARRTLVIAPVAGKINRVLVATKGGSVPPGSPLVEIVPSGDSLLIEALVSPKDIAAIRIGQSAKVNITAYDSSVYGSLTGRVIIISPDAVINDRTGESHYTVRVRTTSTALGSTAGKSLPISPGMIADVSLLGDKQTVLSYIFDPISKLKDTALRE